MHTCTRYMYASNQIQCRWRGGAKDIDGDHVLTCSHVPGETRGRVSKVLSVPCFHFLSIPSQDICKNKVCVYVNVYMYMYVCMFEHFIIVRTCIYVCMYVCMHVCMCIRKDL